MIWITGAVNVATFVAFPVTVIHLDIDNGHLPKSARQGVAKQLMLYLF